MGKRLKLLIPIIQVLLLLMAVYLLFPSLSVATPEHAAETGAPCSTCHLAASGGGTLTDAGSYYQLHGSLPILAAVSKPILHLGKNTLFFVGFIHLLASVIWFGSIFYVHIIIGPSKLRGGLPKEERILGMGALLTVGLSGLFLTLNKVSGFGDFTASLFGKVLAIKILLFLMMTSLALIAITVIHKRLARSCVRTTDDACVVPSLVAGDGREGRSSLVMVDGVVYDVSASALWKDGLHMRRHNAGGDLSDDIKKSPHGKGVLDKFPVVGKTPVKMKAETSPELDTFAVFKVFAFINLFAALMILICIAVWKWGIPIL